LEGKKEPTGRETSYTTVGVPIDYLKDLVDVLRDGYQLEEIEVRATHVRFRLWKEK
jgi:hypothetical protein